MIIPHQLKRMVIFCAIALTILISLPTTLQAASLSDSKVPEQPATLTGPRTDAPIPIYLRPAANQPNVGYGSNGDAVSILEEVGDYLMEGDRAATWSHIRLENAPYTEGWVRGTFLSIAKADISK